MTRWVSVTVLALLGACHEGPPGPGDCEHQGYPGWSGECCRTDDDCAANLEFCVAPGTPLACGICNMDPGDCSTDADCTARGAGMICEPIACACDGERACVRGCIDDTSCDVGTSCDVARARCVATPCTGDAGCPADFSCGANGCARKTCTADGDCDGFCVGGACYPTAGECRGPVA